MVFIAVQDPLACPGSQIRLRMGICIIYHHSIPPPPRPALLNTGNTETHVVLHPTHPTPNPVGSVDSKIFTPGWLCPTLYGDDDDERYFGLLVCECRAGSRSCRRVGKIGGSGPTTFRCYLRPSETILRLLHVAAWRQTLLLLVFLLNALF